MANDYPSYLLGENWKARSDFLLKFSNMLWLLFSSCQPIVSAFLCRDASRNDHGCTRFVKVTDESHRLKAPKLCPMVVPEAVRQKILACRDLALLDRLLVQAATATSPADVLIAAA